MRPAPQHEMRDGIGAMVSQTALDDAAARSGAHARADRVAVRVDILARGVTAPGGRLPLTLSVRYSARPMTAQGRSFTVQRPLSDTDLCPSGVTREADGRQPPSSARNGHAARTAAALPQAV